MSAHNHDNVNDRRRRQASVNRTIEKYQGALALMATWENCPDTDPDYLKQLRKKVDMYRNQLRYKNVDICNDYHNSTDDRTPGRAPLDELEA